MPWEPEHEATDIRRIVGNLLAFIETNQSDALEWASPDRELMPLTFYPTAEVRMLTDFPHCGIVRRRVTVEEYDDGLHVRYELLFEFELEATHTKETRTAALLQLQKDSDACGYALESMLLNIPQATLFAGVTGTGHGRKTVTSLDPLEVAVSETRSLFNEQIVFVLECVESPYN